MLPSYPNYINFHHKIILKPIVLASVVLNLCFINNYHDLSFNEFFIGIYAIFLLFYLVR
ncbi:O-antigen/teichoic acid export membrane protein [Providencia alcalifaciens]|nr:O-antigen/teichoic acid export membrane protein [Providencia alcalifaciens]